MTPIPRMSTPSTFPYLLQPMPRALRGVPHDQLTEKVKTRASGSSGSSAQYAGFRRKWIITPHRDGPKEQ